MKLLKFAFVASLLFVMLGFTSLAQASPVALPTGCAVLGGAAVTNTGPTVVSGGVCVSPGTAISGFPPGTVSSGSINGNNAAAIAAHLATITAYNTLAGLPFTQNLTGQDLGGKTLTPGVYSFSSSAQLTGPLVLNFNNLDNVSFVFQIGSALTTASGSSVTVENAGKNDNVYWVVGSSATLGTTTSFVGNILAQASITLNTGATINCGSALAINGAVTLDDNTINACSAGGVAGEGGGEGGGTSPTPEPGTLILLLTGGLAIAALFSRRLLAVS